MFYREEGNNVIARRVWENQKQLGKIELKILYF